MPVPEDSERFGAGRTRHSPVWTVSRPASRPVRVPEPRSQEQPLLPETLRGPRGWGLPAAGPQSLTSAGHYIHHQHQRPKIMVVLGSDLVKVALTMPHTL